MIEIIFKKQYSNKLVTYLRDDGSSITEKLGPDIPHHDLAHFVVEQEFSLEHGFRGNINKGMTIAQLSDKTIIKDQPVESWLAEVMTRNLQALQSGAAEPNQFIKLVQWEAQSVPELSCPPMTINQVQKMKSQYRSLCEDWEELPENETIKLFF